MSEEHAHVHAPDYEPEGTFEFTNGKLAMWLFLVSDAMAFIGFLGAYMVLRISSGAEGSVGWNPAWGPDLDKIITGFNTFVLICSSVTMVKAFSNLLDGNIKRCRMFLLGTILGGAFFVGFQAFEWTHFLGDPHPEQGEIEGLGIRPSGLVVPDLELAYERARAKDEDITKFQVAEMLYGVRNIPEDFDVENFTEEEYLEHLTVVKDESKWDLRPVGPGVIHRPDFGVPSMAGEGESGQALVNQSTMIRDELTPKDLRRMDARVSTGFASTFFLLTGFHGLHVLIGVIYMVVVWFKVGQGAFSPENPSPVEVAGLYWHFVDLVWVLLFMLIYLI